MCVAQTKIRNPRYWHGNKKIKHAAGYEAQDERLNYITINCGTCADCRRQKRNEWWSRINEEWSTNKCGQFVTLTLSEESINEIETITNSSNANNIATYAVKIWRGNWRKARGHSPRHFLITELGHVNTERVHLHGLIFEEKKEFGVTKWLYENSHKHGKTSSTLNDTWLWGRCSIGYSEINEKMINYVLKYITKTDTDHEGFFGKILVSPGIGKNYVLMNSNKHCYNMLSPKDTNTKYRAKNGQSINMPKYYRQKIYDVKEREILRLINEDKEEIEGTIINGWRELRDYRTDYKATVQQYNNNTTLKAWQQKKEWPARRTQK